MHAQLFCWDRGLIFGLSLHQHPFFFVCASRACAFVQVACALADQQCKKQDHMPAHLYLG